MKSLTIVIFAISIIYSCNSRTANFQNSREQLVEQKARDFFNTFADRNDWDKFCSFYREDVAFKDIILQLELDSLWQFKRFYNWDGEGDAFKKLTPDQKHLILESLVANDSVVVGKGYFNPYYYHGQLVDTDWGMEFTIWLYFDEQLKIYKQIDWIEYDPQTLQHTVQRCNEYGFDAIPEWLDLSRDK